MERDDGSVVRYGFQFEKIYSVDMLLGIQRPQNNSSPDETLRLEDAQNAQVEPSLVTLSGISLVSTGKFFHLNLREVQDLTNEKRILPVNITFFSLRIISLAISISSGNIVRGALVNGCLAR